MVDHPVCQARLIVFNQRDTIFSGNIFRADDYEFFPRDPWAKGNFFYFSPGNPAPNGGAVEHSRKYQVVDIACESLDFVAPLETRNRSADDAVVLHANSEPEPSFPTGFSGSDSVRQASRNVSAEVQQSSTSSLRYSLSLSHYRRTSLPKGSPGKSPSLNTTFPRR